MREFSFMNVSESDAWEILDYFKKKNSRKPLIVEAKSSGGGSRWGDRRWRGWYRWGSRWGDRGGSRGWNRWGRSGERRGRR